MSIQDQRAFISGSLGLCPKCGKYHPTDAAIHCPESLNGINLDTTPGGIEIDGDAPVVVLRSPWVCPVCGAGNAPWVDKCGCREKPVFNIPPQPTKAGR